MPAAPEGWYWLHGMIVKPEGVEHRATRTLYAHRVDGEFALLPMDR
jgi:hypothetical protein